MWQPQLCAETHTQLITSGQETSHQWAASTQGGQVLANQEGTRDSALESWWRQLIEVAGDQSSQ